MDYKNSIINELVKVQREGMPELIKFLETSDFFRAPASSKHHGVFPGGLAKHSLNVFMLLKEKNENLPNTPCNLLRYTLPPPTHLLPR